MTHLIANACTLATLTAAALAGRASGSAANALPLPNLSGPTPAPHHRHHHRHLVPAPAPVPPATACPTHGNVTAWKTFNGDQTPGLGAALLPHHYKPNTNVTGYICNDGSCTRKTIVPPLPLVSPAGYLQADPEYGPQSVNHDLKSFTTLQNLALTGDATDACFAYELTRSFAGQPVFAAIAQNSAVTPSTSAAFLQSFFSKVPNLADSLQHYPEQAPVYYNLITAYRGNCSTILGDYIGSSRKP